MVQVSVFGFCMSTNQPSSSFLDLPIHIGFSPYSFSKNGNILLVASQSTGFWTTCWLRAKVGKRNKTPAVIVVFIMAVFSFKLIFKFFTPEAVFVIFNILTPLLYGSWRNA